MKKLWIFLFLIGCFIFNNVEAKKIVGEMIAENPSRGYTTVISTDDGGIVAVGTALNEGSGGKIYFQVPYLIKYDKDFNFLWENELESVEYEGNVIPLDYISLNNVIELENGNLFAVGSISSPSMPFVMMFDCNGQFLWTEVYPSSDMSESGYYSDVAIFNNQLYAVGTINDPNVGYRKGLVSVFDLSGNNIRNDIYDRNVIYEVNRIVVNSTSDKYALVGKCFGDTNNNYDGCLVSFDNTNTLIKQLYYADSVYNVNLTDAVWNENGDITARGVLSASEDYFALFSCLFFSDGSGTLTSTPGNVNYISSFNIATSNTSSMILYPNKMWKFEDSENDYFSITNLNKTGTALFSDSLSNIVADDFAKDLEPNFYSDFTVSNGSYVVAGNFVNETPEGPEDYFTGFLVKYNVEYDINVMESKHGRINTEIDGDKVKITVVPDEGYELGMLSGFYDNGDSMVFELNSDGSYSIDLKSTPNITAYFKKIELGELVPFNKEFNTPKGLYSLDMYMMSLYKTMVFTKNGYLVGDVDVDSLNNGKFLSSLTLFDNSGKELESSSFDNLLILDLAVIGEDYFALILSPINYELFIYKFDSNLNKIAEANTNISFFSIGEYYMGSKMYGMSMFKVIGDNLYFGYVTGFIKFDSELNLLSTVTTNDSYDEVCNVFRDACYYLGSSDGESILGYDKKDSKEVFSGVIDNVSFVKLLEGEDVVFDIKFDDYVSFSNARIIDKYVVVVATCLDDRTEILVFDFDGNVVQNIDYGLMYMNLLKAENGFVVTAVNYADTCPEGVDDLFCIDISNEYYNLQYNVFSVISDNGKISIPDYAKAGEEVKFTVEPKFGYTFKGLKITDSEGNVTMVTGDSFIMPEGDVTIEPIFEVVNPNTGMFLSIGLIGILIYVVYLFKFSKKIKIKRFSF